MILNFSPTEWGKKLEVLDAPDKLSLSELLDIAESLMEMATESISTLAASSNTGVTFGEVTNFIYELSRKMNLTLTLLLRIQREHTMEEGDLRDIQSYFQELSQRAAEIRDLQLRIRFSVMSDR